jgi:hypothetical protein
MARKLRIGVSVFFGLVAFALCVLWAASLYGMVRVTGQLPGRYDIAVQSFHGGMSIHFFRGTVSWSIEVAEAVGVRTGDGRAIDNPNFFFSVERRPVEISIYLPVWFAALACGVWAASIWQRFPVKFSLRTLMISMTLVAVVLGLAVWAGR